MCARGALSRSPGEHALADLRILEARGDMATTWSSVGVRLSQPLEGRRRHQGPARRPYNTASSVPKPALAAEVVA